MVEMSGREIYDNFRNGIGAEGLASSAAMVKKIAGRYQDRAAEIQQLVSEMESAWQGIAAGRARRGAGPLLTEHEVAGHHFSTSEDLTDRQSGSFSRAKNSVVPVPPAPTDVPPWGPMSPDWVPYLQRVQSHHDAARHNVDVMNSYSGASSYNTENLPTSYGTLADDQAGATIDRPDTIDVESFHDTNGDTSHHTDDEPVNGTAAGPPAPGPVTGPEPSDTALRPTVNPSPPVPGQPTPGHVTTPGSHSPVPSPHPSTPLPATDYGPGRPTPTGGGPVSGVGVLGVGAGYPPAMGRGPTGEFGGPRGGGPVGGPLPRGAVPGADPHTSARPTAPSGPVTTRSAGTNAVPIGAGRSRDEEDTERKAPTYLGGGDPEDLFGTEQLTAPPVIGDEDDD